MWLKVKNIMLVDVFANNVESIVKNLQLFYIIICLTTWEGCIMLLWVIYETWFENGHIARILNLFENDICMRNVFDTLLHNNIMQHFYCDITTNTIFYQLVNHDLKFYFFEWSFMLCHVLINKFNPLIIRIFTKKTLLAPINMNAFEKFYYGNILWIQETCFWYLATYLQIDYFN
jgi:hypothetical protein